MVQQIMHDPLYLAQKSAPATKADLQVGKDLQDTFEGTSGRLRWNGSKYDWSKEEYHYCKYGNFRCSYV